MRDPGNEVDGWVFLFGCDHKLNLEGKNSRKSVSCCQTERERHFFSLRVFATSPLLQLIMLSRKTPRSGSDQLVSGLGRAPDLRNWRDMGKCLRLLSDPRGESTSRSIGFPIVACTYIIIQLVLSKGSYSPVEPTAVSSCKQYPVWGNH